MKGKNNAILSKLTNILLDILIFIFGIILLISIYKEIQIKILGNSYSSFFGYSIFEVQTGSMSNYINISDWIIVKSSNEIKLGDVITYEKDGDFITHRVVEKYKGTYITKGDANNAKDDPVSQEQIVGVVKKIIPNFGIIRKTILNPIILLLLIVTLYLFNFSFRKNNKEIEKTGLSKKIDIIFEKIADRIIKNLDSKSSEKVIDDLKKDSTKKEFVENDMASLDDDIVPPVSSVDQEVKIEDNKDEVEFEQVAGTPLEENAIENFEKYSDLSEEDLDKTIYYRAVKVDVSELDDTFDEIKHNQAIIDEQERKLAEKLANKKKVINDDLDDDDVDDSLIKNSLELLQKKDKRKFNNIIDKVMYLKSKELDEIIEVLNDGKKLLTNESSIKNSMIKDYIDARYYNHCGDANAEFNGKNMISKITSLFYDIASDMTKSYKGSDSKYGEKTIKYANLFVLVLSLEQLFLNNDSINDLRINYTKKMSKYFKENNLVEKRQNDIINEIIKIQKKYNGMIKFIIKKLETDMFELEYNKLTSDKNMYGLDLKHKISFSKVYSDYIVDKTYSEGIIAEDKVIVLISLLSSKVVSDILLGNFNSKYVLSLPDTIYAKDNKLGQFVKVTGNEYLKNNIYILINYKTLISNKKVVKELKKVGYKFALVFNDTVKVEAKNQAIINVVDYIYMNKKSVDTASIISTLPEDAKKHVVFEDIEIKVGNYGGE